VSEWRLSCGHTRECPRCEIMRILLSQCCSADGLCAEYVDLYIDWVCNKSIAPKFEAFKVRTHEFRNECAHMCGAAAAWVQHGDGEHDDLRVESA
jgi:hypothetical protein